MIANRDALRQLKPRMRPHGQGYLCHSLGCLGFGTTQKYAYYSWVSQYLGRCAS